MKFLAILRDSFREALDNKVMYVTLSLSALLILFVGSITFRPLTMRQSVEGLADQLNTIFRLQAHGADIRCEIADYREANPEAHPWETDPSFTFVLRFPDAVTATLASTQKSTIKQALPALFWWSKDLEVKDGRSSGNAVRLAVRSRGTVITDLRGWTHEPALFFGAIPLTWFRNSLNYSVYWIENRLVNTIGGWVAVLLGIIVTASFLPHMLQKGAVDLLLAKPIDRPRLLVFKYVGGLTFLFVNAAVVIFGVWLMLGLRTNIWAPGFLLTTFVITFFFAILYAVSVLFAVLTRSTVVCILLALIGWFGLWLTGFLQENINPPRVAAPGREVHVRSASDSSSSGWDVPRWVAAAVNIAHTVLPRTSDLNTLTTRLLSRELLTEPERRQQGLESEHPFSWGESLGISAAFIALMLGLACWRFITRDF